MTHNDIHIHAPAGKLKTTARELLRAMDHRQIEKVAIMSWYGRNLAEQKRHIEEVAALAAECPDRIYGLAWVEPLHKTPLSLLDWAMEKKHFRGFKMIPNRWSPCEDRILKYCARMAELNAPCLLHSGILYFETFSSRFCRPADYEMLLTLPRFRFALAHISWPWTDECLALFGQARAARAGGYSTAEMFIDLTPGTPPDYRQEALRRLLRFGAEDSMIFGTDSTFPDMDHSMQTFQKDTGLLRRLKAPAATRQKIFRTNFERFFGGS